MLIAKFDNSGVAEKVSILESQYNFVFPQHYKEFPLRYNGGYTPRTKVKIKKTSTDIKGFYGIGAAELSLNQESLEIWIQKRLFPIACDSFGNIFLLCIAGDGYGNIFFGDHEKGMAQSMISNDFSSFLRICKSDKIPDAARRSVDERKADLIARGRENIITPALIEMWKKEIGKYGGMIQEEVII